MRLSKVRLLYINDRKQFSTGSLACRGGKSTVPFPCRREFLLGTSFIKDDLGVKRLKSCLAVLGHSLSKAQESAAFRASEG